MPNRFNGEVHLLSNKIIGAQKMSNEFTGRAVNIIIHR